MNGLGVHALVLAGIAFVVGLMVGGAGPRAELREVREELFELQRQRVARRGVTEELLGLVRTGLDEVAERREPPAPAPTPAALPDAPLPEPVDVEEPGVDEASLEVAREALALRAAQARAALDEDIEPTPEQAAAIDATVDRMNDRLIGIAYRMLDELEATGAAEPSRRAMMGLAADALDALVVAEDELLGVMTDAQRAAVREEATDPLSFVDPAVLDVFAQFEPAEAP